LEGRELVVKSNTSEVQDTRAGLKSWVLNGNGCKWTVLVGMCGGRCACPFARDHNEKLSVCPYVSGERPADSREIWYCGVILLCSGDYFLLLPLFRLNITL